MRILIIDDGPHDREVIGTSLQEHLAGIELIEVSSRSDLQLALAKGGMELAERRLIWANRRYAQLAREEPNRYPLGNTIRWNECFIGTTPRSLPTFGSA